MSLHTLSQHMASKGRNGDSMLLHVTPSEVQGLHGLAKSMGTEMTINPDTGLYEASFMKDIFPMIVAGIATILMPAAAPLWATMAVGGGVAAGATALAGGSGTEIATSGILGGAGAAFGGALGALGTGVGEAGAAGAKTAGTVGGQVGAAAGTAALRGAGTVGADAVGAAAGTAALRGAGAVGTDAVGTAAGAAGAKTATQLAASAGDDLFLSGIKRLPQAPQTLAQTQAAGEAANAARWAQTPPNPSNFGGNWKGFGTQEGSNMGRGIEAAAESPWQFAKNNPISTVGVVGGGVSALNNSLTGGYTRPPAQDDTPKGEYDYNQGYDRTGAGNRFFSPDYGYTAYADGGEVYPDTEMLANGGIAGLGSYSDARGHAVVGPGTGTSDSVPAYIEREGRAPRPARLSDGEFVLPKKTVNKVGGAKQLYAMMDRIDKSKKGGKKHLPA